MLFDRRPSPLRHFSKRASVGATRAPRQTCGFRHSIPSLPSPSARWTISNPAAVRGRSAKPRKTEQSEPSMKIYCLIFVWHKIDVRFEPSAIAESFPAPFAHADIRKKKGSRAGRPPFAWRLSKRTTKEKVCGALRCDRRCGASISGSMM
jgi:hypothetical protein